MDRMGMVTSTRTPMKGASFFYDSYYEKRNSSPPRFTREWRNYSDIYQGSSQDLSVPNDSVWSYRTGQKSDLSSTEKLFIDADRKYPDSKNDVGHEFDLKKSYIERNRGQRFVSIEDTFFNFSGDFRWGYRGPVGFFGRGLNNPGRTSYEGAGAHFFGFSDNHGDIDISLGAKAIAAVAPTKSEANIAASLLELRDGFPKMIGKALRTDSGPRALGSEYLNFVFGWLPTISDIRQIAVAMVNARKIITQYQRDADRIVRRRFGFPFERVSSTHRGDGVGTNLILLPSRDDYQNGFLGYTGWRSESGSYSTTLRVENQKHVWFSGAFRYHLATGDDVFSRIDRTGQVAAKWLGARADARAFWQAMPWSWFIDWISDVGAIVDNANAAALDGQVLQWGYLMQRTLCRRTFMTDSTVVYNYSDRVRTLPLGNLMTTGVTERKQRIRATPFGFGLNPDSFSAQQWAILGALGMTRGPNRLW